MRKTTLITDFDNTLYDWFHMWHQSFSAMLAEIVRISGVSEDVLIPQIRSLHQKYRTSEYAFLIEELPALRQAYPGQDIPAIFDNAVHAYRKARKASLALYDGVMPTLARLRATGVLIVVYTESLAYYTNFRVRRLELDDMIDFLYSPQDHEIPAELRKPSARSLNAEENVLLHVQHRFIPKGVIKPNPEVLLDIIGEIKRAPDECIYLGDSLMKDVAMAQDAGVTDVLAEYGGVQHREEYELLRKVSHWTDEDVKREQTTSRRTIEPSHVIAQFSDIAAFFEGCHVEPRKGNSTKA
jgi:FMN phosphatase YigB (HAD superfamily)